MILPDATLGILGGGQLGRMFTLAARRMGYRVTVFAPDDDTPAGQIAYREVRAPYEDLPALRRFATAVDVVTFEFAALDFADPRRNRYVYRLEGFDSEWIDLDHVNRLTYTDLRHGQYVLRVKAANNDGVWNEEGLALKISVAPPVWRTWWAYILYALVAGGAVVTFVRAQRPSGENATAFTAAR